MEKNIKALNDFFEMIKDPKNCSSILDAWEISNYNVLWSNLLEKEEFPAILDEMRNEWKFKGMDMSKNYVKKED